MKKLNSKEVNAFIKKHKHLSYTELAEKLGLNVDAVRKRYRSMGLPPKRINAQNSKNVSATEQVAKDRETFRGNMEDSIIKKKYKLLVKEYDEISAKLDTLLGIKVDPFEVSQVAHGEGEATAVMVLSDTHFEENIDADTVNGLNQFDLEVARQRGEAFFRNGLRLIKLCQRDVKIERAIIPILGDIINNHIHEELMEENHLLPMEAVIFAENLIIGGIKYLLENTELKFTMICHSGNHGRTTKDRRISTEAGNSLEFLMYHHLKNQFSEEDRVEVIIPRGYHSYITLYGKYDIRFHHGHAMRYGGGVGGIYIPVNKAIAQWNKLRRAYLDVFGHFHQFRDGGNFISNGSLCGYNAYALSIKADYEEPRQAFFLIDKKRGKTIVAPILLNE